MYVHELNDIHWIFMRYWFQKM